MTGSISAKYISAKYKHECALQVRPRESDSCRTTFKAVLSDFTGDRVLNIHYQACTCSLYLTLSLLKEAT